MSHTPEPWRKPRFPAVAGGQAGEFVGIADCRSVYVTEDEAQANARRIVACVNALAGVPTEVLETLAGDALAKLFREKGLMP